MTTLRLRDDLDDIPVYRQGKSVAEDAVDAFKMSSNENPYPPLPSVQQRIIECVSSVNRYPDFTGAALVEALAELHGVAPAQIVLGGGSTETMSQLIRATAGHGDEVLFAWRSFEIYPKLARTAGAVPVMVPLDEDHRHDLDAMADAVTERTRLIIVCNPNNPTGTVVSRAELERFLERVPSDVTVAIDEAYRHFSRGDERVDGTDFFKRYPNVAVANTFSKAYGLAGLRVGYALAPERLADMMSRIALAFNVTSLAQQAALASLDADEELQARVDELVDERERVVAALRAEGWEVAESGANFIWLPLGDDSEPIARLLEESGLVTRPFPGEGLRISLAEPEANTRLITAMGGIRRV